MVPFIVKSPLEVPPVIDEGDVVGHESAYGEFVRSKTASVTREVVLRAQMRLKDLNAERRGGQSFLR